MLRALLLPTTSTLVSLVLVRFEVGLLPQLLLALLEHRLERGGEIFVLEARGQLLQLGSLLGVVHGAPHERLARVVHRRDLQVAVEGVVEHEFEDLLAPQQQPVAVTARVVQDLQLADT